MSRDFFCERCSLQFGKKYVFDLHLSLVHGEKIEVKVESPLCEENLKDSQINKGKKPFKCSICDSSFSQKGTLKRHMASVHEEKKPFKCPTCDAGFAQKGKLIRHLESVHELKKPFKCPTCDASFAQKSQLKKHLTSVHKENHLDIV